jgi:hypothetical protein
MTTLFTIELTINLADSDRHARQLLNLYFSDMPEDIEQTAFNLCNANAALQARKFGKLNLKRADVWPSEDGGLKIFALISVSGEDSAFIKQVVSKYMDDFPGYLKKAGTRYFSRTGFPAEISLEPTDWNAEIRQAQRTDG